MGQQVNTYSCTCNHLQPNTPASPFTFLGTPTHLKMQHICCWRKCPSSCVLKMVQESFSCIKRRPVHAYANVAHRATCTWIKLLISTTIYTPSSLQTAVQRYRLKAKGRLCRSLKLHPQSTNTLVLIKYFAGFFLSKKWTWPLTGRNSLTKGAPLSYTCYGYP